MNEAEVTLLPQRGKRTEAQRLSCILRLCCERADVLDASAKQVTAL
jgi:hypothetical protein